MRCSGSCLRVGVDLTSPCRTGCREIIARLTRSRCVVCRAAQLDVLSCPPHRPSLGTSRSRNRRTTARESARTRSATKSLFLLSGAYTARVQICYATNTSHQNSTLGKRQNTTPRCAAMARSAARSSSCVGLWMRAPTAIDGGPHNWSVSNRSSSPPPN